MKTRMTHLLGFGVYLLLAAIAQAQPIALAGDEPRPPASPKEFHAQEMERWQRIHDRLAESPILSTRADYDVTYYHLTIDLREYAPHIITGDVRIIVRSVAEDLNELVLDLCGTLPVDSTFCNDEPRPFSREGNTLTVSLDRVYGIDEIAEVHIYYHGTPCQSSSFTSFSYYDRPVGPRRIPSIATLSEPTGSPDWWPCKDDPADKADSVRVTMIVADTLIATSNGLLESDEFLPPDSRVFTWFERYPISNYLVVVNATNYASYREWFVSQTGDSIPIDHYPYPERLSQAETSWDGLPGMMALCENLFGPYPYQGEKYGHTMTNFGGGMEHQCNTSFGRSLTNGNHQYDYIVLHELSHQWWGDDVTLATWPDVWLNEGFASYSEALWWESTHGPQGLREYMTESWGNDVVDPSGPVYNPTDLFSSNTVYDKGSWILHILRGVIRDDTLFFAALREYLNRHSYGNATTVEFLSDVSDVVGYDVAPYLHAYLYRTNRPNYLYSFGTGIVDGESVTVARIRQTQTNPDTTFTTRLDLRFASPQDTVTERVENSAWNERYYFHLGISPTSLTLDPEDWVLKNANPEPLPLTILNESLTDGRLGIDYVDSLVAIGGPPGQQRWSVWSGSLPDGLLLSDDGVLRGIPNASGLFTVQLRVATDFESEDFRDFNFDIAAPLLPPVGLTCYTADPLHITLRWNSVAEADSYRIFFAHDARFSDMMYVATIADTFVVFATDSIFNPPDSTFHTAHEFFTVTAVSNP